MSKQIICLVKIFEACLLHGLHADEFGIFSPYFVVVVLFLALFVIQIFLVFFREPGA